MHLTKPSLHNAAHNLLGLIQLIASMHDLMQLLEPDWSLSLGLGHAGDPGRRQGSLFVWSLIHT
jgi:hypothetical protein